MKIDGELNVEGQARGRPNDVLEKARVVEVLILET